MTTINLLPWREKARVRAKYIFIAGTVGTVVVALLINGLWYSLLQSQINHQVRRNDYLQSEVTLAQQSKTDKPRFDAEKLQILQQATMLQELNNQRFRILELMQLLPKLLPSNVLINAIDIKAMTIELQGSAKTDIQVSELIKRLKQQQGWQQVQLQELNNDPVQATTFKITLSLD